MLNKIIFYIYFTIIIIKIFIIKKYLNLKNKIIKLFCKIICTTLKWEEEYVLKMEIYLETVFKVKKIKVCILKFKKLDYKLFFTKITKEYIEDENIYFIDTELQ